MEQITVSEKAAGEDGSPILDAGCVSRRPEFGPRTPREGRRREWLTIVCVAIIIKYLKCFTFVYFMSRV